MARPEPRSRRQTRGAVLEHLLRKRGAFRPVLAEETALTEASVSRILAELKADNLITESRKPAPYVGGPTGFITLSNSLGVAGLELSNGRLSFGIGLLDGSTVYETRQEIAEAPDQDMFESLCRRNIAALRKEAVKKGLVLCHASVSLPGFGGDAHRANPIFPWDLSRLVAFLDDVFDPIPVTLTNSVIAQAAFDRYAGDRSPVDDDHLFVFVGHGVAGALVSAAGPLDAFSPVELGHNVIQRGGLRCRCGHNGCLEAYTSLRAIAPVVGMSEADMLAQGDEWFRPVDQTPRLRADLRDRLVLLGVSLGNTLNLHRVRTVVVSGWPSLMSEEDRIEVERGIDESLLGGIGGNAIRLIYRRPATGNDPGAALAYAAYAFVRAGGAVDSPPNRSAA